jgi:acyl-CoA synthetase (AMP-forming)/AMP-acid ligase II
LGEKIDGTAHILKEKGVQKGSRVLLLVPPGEKLLWASFALLKMGAVPIVIDPGMGIKDFLAGVRRSVPRFLLAPSRILWLSRLFYRTFGNIRRINVGDFEKPFPRTPSFPTVSLEEHETAAILFTSGSTGYPKGVCYTHRHFYAQLKSLRDAFPIEPGEVDFPLLPIFSLFDPALGMTTVVPRMEARKPAQLDPAKAVEDLRRFRVTNSFGSPRLWSKIVDYAEKQGCVFPSLKRVLVAGAPASPQLLKRVQDRVVGGEVYTPYGATEALPLTLISAHEVLEETLGRTVKGHGTCVGRPLPGVEIRILSDGAFSVKNPLGPFEIGEIVVSGPVVTERYDGIPTADKTHKIWMEGVCWHRMGDVGYMDDRGRLWFCGRRVERVVSGQDVWYTECCEPIFNTHPNVFRSALIGLVDGDKRIPAIVVEPLRFPFGRRRRRAFVEELRVLAAKHQTTRAIERFFFHPSFPVDVRHNAKIHRLKLARYFSKKFLPG